MKYQAKQNIRMRTSRGVVEVSPGQIITLEDEGQAIRLINERKIISIEPGRWHIYSEILQDYLWVVPTLEDAADLIAQGVEGPIYTEEEINWLRGIDRRSLKNIHQAKKAFPGSRVQCHERNKVGER